MPTVSRVYDAIINVTMCCLVVLHYTHQRTRWSNCLGLGLELGLGSNPLRSPLCASGAYPMVRLLGLGTQMDPSIGAQVPPLPPSPSLSWLLWSYQNLGKYPIAMIHGPIWNLATWVFGKFGHGSSPREWPCFLYYKYSRCSLSAQRKWTVKFQFYGY